MRPHLLTPVIAAVATLAVACGGAAGGSEAASGGVVSTRDIDGVGTVLVDKSGMTLYFTEQETASEIRCTGECTDFWHPLTTAKESAPKAGDLPKTLATVKRANGETQLTYGGHPLYTFTEDGGPGSVEGNGFEDTFAGTTFTWRAITPQGTAASEGPSDGGGGGGYGGY